ncbi:hypothetical protein BDN70DRAFT_280035 [Pholiota conissans]|uniref:Uncharacterized protein n=1 Tax=Pholiota conissans TaxID=109636 RepID=A0A9P5ZA87_9AGAR|nr:hypothetical protein BDN70DRAFT_280035 [Pholiota conissans]
MRHNRHSLFWRTNLRPPFPSTSNGVNALIQNSASPRPSIPRIPCVTLARAIFHLTPVIMTSLVFSSTSVRNWCEIHHPRPPRSLIPAHLHHRNDSVIASLSLFSLDFAVALDCRHFLYPVILHRLPTQSQHRLSFLRNGPLRHLQKFVRSGWVLGRLSALFTRRTPTCALWTLT